MHIHLSRVHKAHKEALQKGPSHLQALLKAKVPEGWPQFPGPFKLREDDSEWGGGWPSYFFICPQSQSLVGNGGFSGAPDLHGEIEIGYEIAPAYRDRGYATAAVRKLLMFAFSQDVVQAVVAHTLAEKNASNAVLVKAGLSFAEEVPHVVFGGIWRWRIGRAEWTAQESRAADAFVMQAT